MGWNKRSNYNNMHGATIKIPAGICVRGWDDRQAVFTSTLKK
jgi:hypothetical protein